MESTNILNRKYETIAWGALFIWWGITELVTFLPEGMGALGIGLILLAVNFARSRKGMPISYFSTTIGILALIWGGLELAGAVLSLPFELPIFAILLIALGVIILAGDLTGNREQ